MRFSREVQDILSEAQELADRAGRPLNTAYLLLGVLTSTNRAQAVLRDLRVNPNRIVDALESIKRADGTLSESNELLARVEDRMHEAARRTNATLVSSLHLLMALTREKHSVAYRAFSLMNIAPVRVRTLALARITGPVPRSLTLAAPPRREPLYRDEPSRPVAVSEPEPQLPRPPARILPLPVAGGGMARAAEAQAPRAAPAEGGEAEPAEGRAEPTHVLDPETFPMLTSIGRNLTLAAAEGRLDPVIGRQELIDAMIDVLNKRRSNNPCLVGDPGVGKTAIVEGLALAMLEHGERVEALKDRVIIEIDVGALVAGTELRGSFSRRMARLKDEVKEATGRVIVFIDELHTLIGAGGGDGPLDAANDLKAALARGEFPCIGATTGPEYARYVERDPALERRFQPLPVDEPSAEDTLAILRGIIDRYEAHHGVIYEPAALEAAVRLSQRYIVERRLPDKAINLVDTAAARAVRMGHETVEVRDVAEVVSDLAEIPVERLLMSDAERVLAIEPFLRQRIVGQDDVLARVAEVIQRNSAGFASRRPIGSFLFLGPTGVGKTETAKALADFLFGSKDAMTRLDMSEFMERHAVSRLLGAAPGYVGHEEPGELTAALKRRPYQLILFDEIDKAHADVLNILLQILDEGRVTDARGQTLSLSNTVIILTSNQGSEVLRQTRRVGFADAEDGAAFGPAQRKRMLEAARKKLAPELWGRVDEKCAFAPLGRPEIARVTRLLVDESPRLLGEERDIHFEIDDAVVDYLIDHGGWDLAHGARPMRRALQRTCETAIARSILSGDVEPGDRVRLVVQGGEVAVRLVPPAARDE